MKVNFKDSLAIFKRFMVANLLNLLGLSLAFAAFFIIMVQVSYETGYNKGIDGHEHIYRLALQEKESGKMQQWLSEPMAQMICKASPHIESYSLIMPWKSLSAVMVDEKEYKVDLIAGSKDHLSTYNPQFISGSAEVLERGEVILQESTARRIFGSIDVLNKELELPGFSDKKYIVGGVCKDFPENSALGGKLFVSDNLYEGEWNNWNFYVYVRLDSSENQEDTKNAILRDLKTHVYDTGRIGMDVPDDYFQVVLVPLHEEHFTEGLDDSAASTNYLYLLVCFSVLLVFIAIANFMNFALAQTPMRLRSINTRKVIGASTALLRGSLILESVAYGLVAFLLALVWILVAQGTGIQSLLVASIGLENHVWQVLFLLCISVLAGVLAGVYPAWYATSFSPALVLKGSFGLSPQGRKLRMALVCLQFAISIMLIIGLGIMYLQSRYVSVRDYGFDKELVLVGDVTSVANKQPEAIIEQMKSIVGVEGASFSMSVPGMSDACQHWSWGDGHNKPNVELDVLAVDCYYLDVMGIKLTGGRNFNLHDESALLLNETARAKYPDMELGKPVVNDMFTLLGYVQNFQYHTLRRNDEQSPMALCVYSTTGSGEWRYYLNVRVAAGVDKVDMMHRLQKAAEQFMPGHDCNFRFLDQRMTEAYDKEMRFTHQILITSLLALFISLIGVLGLTLFEGEYRRKEIGVRKIMGSSTSEILYMFNKKYLLMVTCCFAVAAPFGYWLGWHWLEGFSLKTPISPLLFVLAYVLIAAVVALTVSMITWRRANDNPVNSIRTD